MEHECPSQSSLCSCCFRGSQDNQGCFGYFKHTSSHRSPLLFFPLAIHFYQGFPPKPALPKHLLEHTPGSCSVLPLNQVYRIQPPSKLRLHKASSQIRVLPDAGYGGRNTPLPPPVISTRSCHLQENTKTAPAKATAGQIQAAQLVECHGISNSFQNYLSGRAPRCFCQVERT